MILGECSRCGGTVEIPDTWMGIDPPRPRCRRCHATKRMKVIEMDEPKEYNLVKKFTSDKPLLNHFLDEAEYLNKVGNG